MSSDQGNPDSDKNKYFERQISHLKGKLAEVQTEQTEAKKREAEHRGEQLSLNRKTVKFNGRVAFFTGLLFVTSAISGTIAYWQMNQMRESERAWIGPREIRLNQPLSTTDPIRGIAPVVNSGKTMALDVTHQIEAHLSDVPLDIAKYVVEGGNSLVYRGTRSSNALVPGGVETLWVDGRRPFTQPEIDDLNAGRKFLYVYGWIRYRDIYQATKIHTTTFCAMYLPNSPGMGACSSYNSAD